MSHDKGMDGTCETVRIKVDPSPDNPAGFVVINKRDYKPELGMITVEDYEARLKAGQPPDSGAQTGGAETSSTGGAPTDPSAGDGPGTSAAGSAQGGQGLEPLQTSGQAGDGQKGKRDKREKPDAGK